MTEPKITEAKALIKSGDKQGGQEILVKILKFEPDNVEALLWLASIQKEYDKQRTLIEQVLRIDSFNEIALNRLKQLDELRKSKKTHDARPVIEQAEVKPSRNKLLKQIGKRKPLNTQVLPPESKRENKTTLLNVSEEKTRLESDSPKLEQTQADVVKMVVMVVTWLVGGLGVLLLIGSVFVPLLDVPIMGSLNLLNFSWPLSILLIVVALASATFLGLRWHRWSFLCGLIVLFLTSYWLFQILKIQRELQSDIGDDELSQLFGGIITQMFQPQWGWAVLFLGSILIVVAAITGILANTSFTRLTSDRQVQRILLLDFSIPIGGAVLVLLTVGLYYAVFEPDLTSGLSDRATAPIATDKDILSSPLNEIPPDDLGGRNNPIPLGNEIGFERGSIRFLTLERPTSYVVVDVSSLDGDKRSAQSVPGTSFVALEAEFRCASTEVVCDSPPESNLSIILSDGRIVEQESWAIADAQPLGKEDLVGGATSRGWLIFMVPDGTPIQTIKVEPFDGGPAIFAYPPAETDGYVTPRAWQNADEHGKNQYQSLPSLRSELQGAELDTGLVIARFKGEHNYLVIDLCEDVSFYIDETDALNDFDDVIILAARTSKKYITDQESFLINISDCSLVSSEVTFIIDAEDFRKWKVGTYSDQRFLDYVYVSLD